MTSISQVYRKLILIMNAVSISTAGQIGLRINTNTDAEYGQSFTESNQAGGGEGQTYIGLSSTTSRADGVKTQWIIEFDNYSQSTSFPVGRYYGCYTLGNNSRNIANGAFAYRNASTAAITSIQMLANITAAYTFDNGTYELFGVK